MSNYLSPTPLTFYILFYTSLITSIVEVMSARLPDIYWNSTNPIFRIDNTDHVIDVNRGNGAFEYDQINIVCPMYTKGTREDDIETYIIYNVSKEEYDSCHIANIAQARTIAVCDKPFLNRYYTITFRPFTPQPGGLEFHPGQDYYFIALSAKPGDSSNQCQKYHMKVVFKVCCGNNQISKSSSSSSLSSSQQQQQQQQPPRSSIVSKLIPTNKNVETTLAPVVSTSNPIPSSTFSYIEFAGQNQIGVATYKGVISPSINGHQNNLNPHQQSQPQHHHHNHHTHNTTAFPMIPIRYPKPTRSSSQITNVPSSVMSLPNSPLVQNSKKLNHRFYGDSRGSRYNISPQQQQPQYPSFFSTESSVSATPRHGHQINPVRIQHVPYHPYHPRQLSSTPRPLGWRPHPIPNMEHNPPIRLSDHGYKGIYRSNDIREKSDGLNSGSLTLRPKQSINHHICWILCSLCFFHWTFLRNTFDWSIQL
ncbi:Ephrin-A4 [Sarcoptes scabiei]|uniref:Ephrin-B2 n=1 Tax=Sarcoptes scabiei TaxID=52283 RepID=A0A834R9L3_SARSC|nr:Ephrin-A4 [Sarcoptes scabiei]